MQRIKQILLETNQLSDCISMTLLSFRRQLVLANAIIILSLQSAYASRTYNFIDYADAQNGHTLSGSIVTVDSAADDGVLSNSEIVDWNFTVQGPLSYSVSSDESTSLAPITGLVNISSTSITLPFPEVDPGINALSFAASTSMRELDYFRISDQFFVGFLGIYRSSLNANNTAGRAWEIDVDLISGGLGGNDPWVIATIVPEPATLTLAVPLLLSQIFFRRSAPRDQPDV